MGALNGFGIGAGLDLCADQLLDPKRPPGFENKNLGIPFYYPSVPIFQA